MLRHVLPLLPLTLLGCVAQAVPSNALSGSQWRFTGIDGAAPASDQASLGFGDTDLSGTVGCNRMAGPWRVEDGRLIAGPLAQTKMFCDGKVGEQEEAVGALLVSAPEIAFDGDRLSLRSRGHFAEFVRVRSQ